MTGVEGDMLPGVEGNGWRGARPERCARWSHDDTSLEEVDGKGFTTGHVEDGAGRHDFTAARVNNEGPCLVMGN